MKKIQFIYLFILLTLFESCKKEVHNITKEKSFLSKNNGGTNSVLSGFDIPISSIAVSSTSPSLLPASALVDNNISTVWSSSVHSDINSTEWIEYMFNGFYDVNYIGMYPRYSGGSSLGYPVTFSIYYFNGTNWVLTRTYGTFPNPKSDKIILSFYPKINCKGIKIIATKLGKDNVNNAVLQMAEVSAGYDPGFNYFQNLGNNSIIRENEIRNVGSGQFNPNTSLNWNNDFRSPIIAANPGGISNIYAPNASYDSASGTWGVFFGGMDGTTDIHDRISLTLSSDDFLTFGNHQMAINYGTMVHVNNETVIRRPDNTFLMYYTTLPSYTSPRKNKPGYATSANGINWTPNAGSSSYLINMAGYNNWSNADVNGSNVAYYENGIYHLYFTDFNYTLTGHSQGVHHATSTDMINFTYTGDVLNGIGNAQDVKRFTFNNANYYLMLLHANVSQLNYSLGTSPTSFGTSQLFITSSGNADKYITSCGIITNKNRLYGVFYGASSASTLDQNAIFAKWLQKKVIFSNSNIRWGDVEKGYGPNRIKLSMGDDIATGYYTVYDTDGTTLLYTSPLMTIISGDIWNYTL